MASLLPATQSPEAQSQRTTNPQQPFVHNTKPSRIHITGASGSGVSTLGRNLSSALNIPVLDVDDYFWLPTDPPYTNKRSIPERISSLKNDTRCAEEESCGWVLSGSMMSWGDEFMEDIECVIFISASTETGMKRIRERELTRHGERIREGGDMYEESVKFLAWAEAYDDPDLETGRSRVRHEQWLREVKVPVIKLSGEERASVVAKRALIGLRRGEYEGNGDFRLTLTCP